MTDPSGAMPHGMEMRADPIREGQVPQNSPIILRLDKPGNLNGHPQRSWFHRPSTRLDHGRAGAGSVHSCWRDRAGEPAGALLPDAFDWMGLNLARSWSRWGPPGP